MNGWLAHSTSSKAWKQTPHSTQRPENHKQSCASVQNVFEVRAGSRSDASTTHPSRLPHIIGAVVREHRHNQRVLQFSAGSGTLSGTAELKQFYSSSATGGWEESLLLARKFHNKQWKHENGNDVWNGQHRPPQCS